MPILSNPRHERFAQELAKGKSATEAYETAGFKPSRPNASRLQHDDNILQRVSELQQVGAAADREATQKAAEALALDREWVMSRLVDNASKAASEGDYGPSNRALELLGKEIGMFVDRKEVRTGTLDGMNADERQQVRDAIRRELESRSRGGGSAGRAGQGERPFH